MLPNRFGSARADRRFLIYLCILVIFGLVALASATAPVGFSQFHDTYWFIKRQIFFGLIPGLILFIFLARVDCHWWQKYAWLIYGVILFLLLAVFFPGFGAASNGSRWIRILGANIQPSEFAKLGVIIILASLLAGKHFTKWEAWQQSLLPILAILAPSFILIMAQRDIGSLSIITVIVFMMLFVERVPARFLLILGGAIVAAFILLILAAPYRAERVMTFLHPETDKAGAGYQINQALLAIGSGGLWGRGFGHSIQKFQYLPEVSADSIYAVIAEENGLLVATGFVVLILLLIWRGLKIAKTAPDAFTRSLATGIMVWIAWQSFLNMGAIVGVLPLTGVPLPFVSHGGSALAAALAGAGLVVNVSKSSRL